MDPSTQFKLPAPAKVHKGTFIGVMWGGVLITFIFFALRIFVRLQTFRRLWSDDALVLASWLMFITATIIWQFFKDDLYVNLEVSAGQLYPPPVDFSKTTERYLRGSIAIIMLFYTSLWSVKISFLIFFRRLGNKVQGQKYQWWFVLAITVASYFGCLGTIDYKCLGSSFSYIAQTCSGRDRIHFQRRTLISNMVLDVITDTLIITVPVAMLWKVQISLRQKLALAGIFSITVFIMVFAIVRVSLVSSYSDMPDQTWLYLWSSIEQTVAIIVACLASFRTLFVKKDQSKRLSSSEKSDQSGNSRSWLLFFSKNKSRSDASSGNGSSSIPAFSLPNSGNKTRTVIYTRNYESGSQDSTSWESVERIVPINRVHVENTIKTSFSESAARRDQGLREHEIV